MYSLVRVVKATEILGNQRYNRTLLNQFFRRSRLLKAVNGLKG